ncbi:hypothetical protein Turpa_3347 [Turneriella parva DSM 21527]|uniref:SH3 type 3 domain protein n=2 Tax=Turneriella TaxID=338321 RepID=I4B9M8_TURPD|nr:hypothetical protein Turpa_3347 [Turneriella parva DSM 21527]
MVQAYKRYQAIKKICVLSCIFSIAIMCKKPVENNKLPVENKIMYAAAKTGLKVYEQPILNSKVLKDVPFGVMVDVKEERVEKKDLYGTLGRWAHIKCNSNSNIECDGWVLSGELSEVLTPEMTAAMREKEPAAKAVKAPTCSERCKLGYDRGMTRCEAALQKCERGDCYGENSRCYDKVVNTDQACMKECDRF